MPDRIELRSGACSRLGQVQNLVSLLGAVLLLTLSTPLHLKLATLATLYIVHLLVARDNIRRHPPGRLLMRLDGTLLQKTGDVEVHGLVAGAWVSRWLCVIHWTPAEDRKQQHSLVCASSNRPEDYRRMMVLLRLGPRPSRDALSW